MKYEPTKNDGSAREVLTPSSLFDLRCRDGKDREDFNHDPYDHVRHRRSRRHVCIRLEPLEEVLDA